ncbi:LytR/AlgR family response regulator transcription factor [Desertivirga xinjiangensis]|uniref:LytR/AlgR family response regulator transcription factor n=1 Tax=Desertivirga xinjiangensis TaxID=539206 RepID=UPI0021093435|nr:LytTR family DNA-binding domain-containing protein [Pedobacter xinjiangensis]
MRVLIIEDEPLAAEKLIKLLFEYDQNISILETIPSVDTAVSWLKNNDLPDLILLDIHLADGLCFDIFKQVQVKCPVIFCTAYDQYALRAFQLHSIDYLLKPVQYAKLEQSLQKMKDMLPTGTSATLENPGVSENQINEIVDMIKSREPVSYKSRFMVRSGARIRAVKTEDIAYFHSHDKLNLLVTKDGHSYPVDYSLDELIQMLNPQIFFHVNRKLIIHIDSAKEIHPYFKGRLKLVLEPILDEEVIISSQKTPLFKTWLDQ